VAAAPRAGSAHDAGVYSERNVGADEITTTTWENKGSTMNPTAHFERHDFRSGSGTRLGHITVLLMVWTSGQIFGQSSNMPTPISDVCIELNQIANAVGARQFVDRFPQDAGIGKEHS
jgi:hypothetical protein